MLQVREMEAKLKQYGISEMTTNPQDYISRKDHARISDSRVAAREADLQVHLSQTHLTPCMCISLADSLRTRCLSSRPAGMTQPGALDTMLVHEPQWLMAYMLLEKRTCGPDAVDTTLAHESGRQLACVLLDKQSCRTITVRCQPFLCMRVSGRWLISCMVNLSVQNVLGGPSDTAIQLPASADNHLQ